MMMIMIAILGRGVRRVGRAAGSAGRSSGVCESRGKILHTRNRKSSIPLRNATKIPLEISGGNPLEK